MGTSDTVNDIILLEDHCKIPGKTQGGRTEWKVGPMITDGHFNLPHGFLWECTGMRSLMAE